MAVVGFGRASQSIVRYLHESGIRVLVSDIRNYSELSPKEQELLDHCAAEFEGGGHSTGFLSRAAIVVASPGVDHRHSVLEKVRQSGATVLGELADEQKETLGHITERTDGLIRMVNDIINIQRAASERFELETVDLTARLAIVLAAVLTLATWFIGGAG